MAFCRNCGSEIPEGVKFCSSCGAVQDTKSVSDNNGYTGNNGELYNNSINKKRKKHQINEGTPFEKFSKFFGVILLILSLVGLSLDPPLIAMIMSLIIIIAAIFCLSQKYRLKGFTIVALIIAILTLLASIINSKTTGIMNPASGVNNDISSNIETSDDAPSIKIESDASDKVSNTDEADVADESDEVSKVKPIDGVDPDLRAFLDSYEDFMDEYVVFMQKYTNDPGNAISMIGDYATIMEKYGDFAEKMENYDEKEMSTADAKYYLEVTNRINQKLLDIY